MTLQSSVLALVPAFNEAARIGPVVQGAAVHLSVLVVDDGSQDETAARATAAGANVLRLLENSGKGGALQSGFIWALERDFDAVLTLDGDGQHDPTEIPKFLDALARGDGDLIIGHRNFDQMPISRRVANSLGRVALSWAMGRPIRDNQSGYRLLTRPVLEVVDPSVGGFEYEVEMIAQTIWAGLRIGWVPIRTIYAGEGSHIQPIGHIVRYLRLVWRLRRQRMQYDLNPIKE